MLWPRHTTLFLCLGFAFPGLITHSPCLFGVDPPSASPTGGIGPKAPPAGYVIGGDDVELGAYPWMGGLIRKTPSNNSLFCGCTAIDPYWVLTAAHCVEDGTKPEDFRVLFGSGFLGNHPDNLFFEADAIIIHANYSSVYDLEYDIALVKLKSPLPESIPVLPLISDPSLERDGEPVKLVGWGSTNYDFRNLMYPLFLQEADVSLISREIANGPSYFQGYVTENMLAAGSADPYASSHFGDSGGPLLGFNGQLNRWEQIGTVSFGAGCGKGENPIGVYTRLSQLKPWIDGIIRDNFFNWARENGIDPYLNEDSDNHASLAEYLFGLDPREEDSIAWQSRFEADMATGSNAIVLPVRLRRNDPKLGFHFEKSLDLETWDGLELSWDQFAREQFPETGETLYHIPLVSRSDPEGFYRLRRQDFDGILYGPYPLRVGSSAFGQFNQDLETAGITRYDYFIDNLGVLEDIRLAVVSDVASPIRLRVVDMETGKVIFEAEGDATPGSNNRSAIAGIFSPERGKQYLARVESTQQDQAQKFTINADRGGEETVLYPGSVLDGSLTPTDASYKRPNHFADTYRAELQSETNYLFVVKTEAFEPIILVQDLTTLESIQEVHEGFQDIPEYVWIRTGIEPKIEVTVSSLNPNEQGAYSIEVHATSEPTAIRPGELIVKFFNSSDTQDIRPGRTLFVDNIYLDLEGVENSVTVYVIGFDSFRPTFQVWNLTDESELTDMGQWAFCEDRSFSFTPEEDKAYAMQVIARESQLGENYWVGYFENNETSAAPSVLAANPQKDWAPVLAGSEDLETFLEVRKGRRGN